MRSLIGVLDLTSGVLSERPCDTLTLDVPRDLPRTGGVVSVENGLRGRYLAADGHDAPRRTLSVVKLGQRPSLGHRTP